MNLRSRLRILILFITYFSTCWCATIQPNSDSFSSSNEGTIDSSQSESQSNIFRPDLGCILFGEVGCSISCNVMCDMYGCQNSEPVCLDDIYCECNEVYEISSSIATTAEYNRLSFNKLWSNKISKTDISKKIRKKIFQYPETFDEILKILRDPHKTGLHVKRRLQDLHPSWTNVLKLEPRKIGYINNLIEGEQFDDDGLKVYLENNMEPLVDQLYTQLQKVKHKMRLGSALDHIDKDDDIKHIIKQIVMAKKDSLYDYAKNHLKQKGFQVEDVAKSLNTENNSDVITIYDTDQLILASVVEKLLDIKEDNQIEGDSQDQYMKKTFSLDDEMTVGQEDLFDSDFQTNDDDDTETDTITKSFVLSNEMKVGKDDLYDADFGRSIRSSESKQKRKRNTEKTSFKNQEVVVGDSTNSMPYGSVDNNINTGYVDNNNNENKNNNGYYTSYYAYGPPPYYGPPQGYGYFAGPPPPPPPPPLPPPPYYYGNGYGPQGNYFAYNIGTDGSETDTNVCCNGYSSTGNNEKSIWSSFWGTAQPQETTADGMCCNFN